MRRALKKLNSQQGASILLALLFFLVCAFVGAVILGSATTNAQKVQDRWEDQQAYYAVSSAAQLLRDTMADSVFAGWEDLVQYDCPYGGHSGAGPHLCDYETEFLNGQDKSLLSDLTWAVYRAQLIYASKTSLALPYTLPDFQIEADGMPAVDCALTMDKDYNLTVRLSAAGKAPYAMWLSMTAVASVSDSTAYASDLHTIHFTDDEGQESTRTESYTKTTRTRTTKIAWLPAEITKADGAEEVTSGD